MAKQTLDIILAGVGGQGNILASRIIGDAAIKAGYHVAIGETFGIGQRGGPVSSHVRLGRTEIYGPLIPSQQCEVVVGLEPLEALRSAVRYLVKDGVVVTNMRPIIPVEVTTMGYPYPTIDEILQSCRRIPAKVYTLDSYALAEKAGGYITQNIVMVGALAGTGVVPVTEDHLRESIRERLGRAAEQNIQAFELGRQAVLEQKPAI